MKEIRPHQLFQRVPYRLDMVIELPQHSGIGGITLLETACLIAGVHIVAAKDRHVQRMDRMRRLPETPVPECGLSIYRKGTPPAVTYTCNRGGDHRRWADA